MSLARTFALITLLMTSVQVLAETPKPQQHWVLVNGGSSYASNYISFEIELEAMARFAPKGATISILNAAGKESKGVAIDSQGLLLRDEKGDVKLFGSQSNARFLAQGIEVQGATPVNLFKTLGYNAPIEQAPKHFVLYMGDHGSPQGTSLWNDGSEGLPVGGLLEADSGNLAKHLNTAASVRAIFAHCFAGASMVSPSRKVPSEEDLLLPFLDRHYQANHCSFGVSRHDELGYTNIELNKNLESNVLNSYLSTHPQASLKNMYEFFSQAPTKNGTISTPVLSSDYLTEDLTSYICMRSFGPLDKQDKTYCETCTSQRQATPLVLPLTPKELQKLRSSLCQGLRSLTHKAEDLNKDVESLIATQYELATLMFGTAMVEFIRSQPTFAESVQKAYEQEALLREAMIHAKSDEEIKSNVSEFARARDYRPKLSVELSLKLSGMSERVQSFVEAPNAQNAPNLMKWLEKARLPAAEQANPKAISKKLGEQLRKTQSERKALILSQRKERDGLLAEWLKKDAPEAVRTRYKNILECESRPLRDIQ